MKNSVFSIIMFTIFSVALTACNGGGGGGGGGGSAKSDTPPAETPDDTPDTIEFAIGAPRTTIDLFEGADEAAKIAKKEEIRNDSVSNGALGDSLGIFRDGLVVSQIDDPILILSLTGTNISGVTAYVNAKYEAPANTADEADRATIFTGIADGVTLNVSTNDKIWTGFNSQEITHLSWSNGTTIDGMMIAGSVTTDFTSLTTDNVKFTGKGSGIYGAGEERYNTLFDVNATVDFSTKMLILSTANTCKATDCASNAVEALDFTTNDGTKLSFVANDDGSHYISDGAITSAGGLTGTVDARFYGSVARELGGTFLLSAADKQSYYFGAFGADIFKSADTLAINTVQTVTETPETLPVISGTNFSLTTSAGANNQGLVLNGLTVILDNDADYARAPTATWADTANLNINTIITPAQINFSAVGFDFVNGDGTTENITAYVADRQYTTGVTIDRSAIFGFDSDYMAYVTWQQEQTTADLDDEATDQTLNNNYITMIAGIETTTVPTGSSSGKATFMGRGKGVYGTATLSDDVTFGIIATAVFTTNTLTIATDGTACDAGATCNTGVTASDLDFDINLPNYTGNNLTTSLTNVDGMNGQLNARFYGNSQAFESDGSVTGANELGGTFALAEADTSYYYGAFGANRGVIDFTFTSANTQTTNTSIGDITVVGTAPATVATSGAIDSTNSTLRGLAVSLNDSTKYLRPNAQSSSNWNLNDTNNLNISRVFAVSRAPSTGTLPAVSLTFTGNAITGFTAYADAEYTGVTVDRKDIFGFGATDSQYMAYVTWSKAESFTSATTGAEQNVTNIDGMMIAGIETATADFNNLGADGVVFTGKGTGVYDNDVTDSTASYDTVFNLTATVNFGASKNVMISSSETCLSTNPNCTASDTADWKSNLNFTTASLDITGNNISDNNVTAGGLTGALDARFYGANAKELGGTFALANTTSYYYGAFGANRAALPLNTTSNAVTSSITNVAATNPTAVDTKTHASLTAVATAANGATAIDIVLQGMAVESHYNSLYNRADAGTDWLVSGANNPNGLTIASTSTLSRITSPAVTLTFDADGTSVSAVSAYDNANYTNATIDRNTIFGFAGNADADYMAYVTWNEPEARTLADISANSQAFNDYNGMMIVGIETVSNLLLTDGIVDFTGNGTGVYGTLSGMPETVTFGVTAAVDFTNDSVIISTTGTSNTNLNIPATTIGYNDANALTHEFDGVGTNHVANMAGHLDARFYGAGTNEFGGTFALASATSYYYGAFGANRGNVFISSDDATINVANKANASTQITSSTATAFTGAVTLKSLAVSLNDVHNYTRYRTTSSWTDASDTDERQIDRQITPTPLTNSGVSITFGTGGAADAVTAINAEADYTTGTIDRSAIFGFADNSNYMAYVTWSTTPTQTTADLTAGSDLTDDFTNIDGMMIAGIETADASLLTAGDISFTGKGAGVYGTLTGTTLATENVTFNVTAAVDLTLDMVTISTTGTDNSDNASVNLNMPATTIGYNNVNALTHEFDGVGTNHVANMAGHLDARFYGTGTNEFGGTFALASATNYYYGAFGATRDIILNTSINNIGAATDAELSMAKGIPVADNDGSASITVGAAADETYILKGLGVFGNITTAYNRASGDSWDYAKVTETTSITTLSETRLQLTHTGGNITAVSVSLDDMTGSYSGTVTDGTEKLSKLSVSPLTATSPLADATSTLIEGYRGDEFFGFDSDHMIASYWNLKNDSALSSVATDTDDRTYNIDGVMIAGLETATIPTPMNDTKVRFVGKGRGFYSNADTRESYQTSFRTDAYATFGASTSSVTISSSDTICETNGGCATVALAASVSALDFTTSALNFTSNAIAGTVTAGDLSGNLDSRFYGKSVNAAQEFGGTFAIKDSDESYYGAFGTAKTDFHIAATTTNFPTWSDETERTMDGLGYTTGDDAPLIQTFKITQAASGIITDIEIKTLDVHGDTERTQNFDQSVSGNDYLHINDASNGFRFRDYTVTSFSAGSLRFIHRENTYDGRRIMVVHQPDASTWGWQYQTLGVIDDDIGGKGGFSTGAFTNQNDIPTTGSQTFTGRAYGYYNDNGTEYVTRGNVSVTTDFVAGTAAITASDTRRVENPLIKVIGNSTAYSGNGFNSSSGAPDSNLDFSGTLTYNKLHRWWRGDITAGMGGTGDVVMKAYGPNAEEVGGVFNFENGTKKYAGAFGAK